MGNVGGLGGIRPDRRIQAAEVTEQANAAGVEAAAIGRGARGEEVKTIQTLLAAAGFSAGAADGIFGPKTASAIAQFQRAQGLAPSGSVDAATMAALEKAAGAKGAQAPASTGPLASTPNAPVLADGKPRIPPTLVQGEHGTSLLQGIGCETLNVGEALDFYPLNSSARYYAWSNPRGAGGFENEGQGLAVYDTKTGTIKQVMSETAMIDDVQAVRLCDGREALLVQMTDGGAGAPHVAIVDPERGEVYSQGGARFAGTRDGKVTIEKVEIDGDSNSNVIRRETLDLASVLGNPVIHNKRDLSYFEPEGPAFAKKPTNVKFELLEEGESIAKMGGKEVYTGKGAVEFFELKESPTFMAWSTQWGAGGFENEGQGLSVYNTKTGEIHRDILSEYYMIDDVKSARLPDGREALLVSMSDGGAGAPHIAVVDPERGEVFRLTGARFGPAKDGKVAIEKIEIDGDTNSTVIGRESLDLASVLGGPTLLNPREHF